MWFKLCLLLIYITTLFILTRLLEAISGYETGSLSKRLLDPMTLSVLKLKALLEQRGVSFEGIVLEKSELTDLVEGSGHVTDEDVDSAMRDEGSEGGVTNFTSGSHFFEQVEDAKDSVWLIQVYRSDRSAMLLGDERWMTIRKKVSRFGVRSGVFDCSLDMRYCRLKGWHKPHLILALPGEFETKSNVNLHIYAGPMKLTHISDWIREKLVDKVENITDEKYFIDNWYSRTHSFLNPEIRIVYFTNQKNIPIFYTALSVKFPGRVKFGVVDISSSGGKQIMKYMTMKNQTKMSTPTYVIMTSESIFAYGLNQGESFSFSSLESYLRILYPCLNDLFIITFLVSNLTSILELCLVQGRIYKRLKKALWYLIKCNIMLIMLWLPLVGLFQLPYLDKFPLWLLKCLRLFATTNLATLMRKDMCFYSRHSTVAPLIFMTFALLVAFFEYRRKRGQNDSEQEEENYWNFTEMRTLEHLLRPSDIRVLPPTTIGLLGNRYFPIDTPSRFISYVADLPRWPYLLPHVSNSSKCRVCYELTQYSSNLETDLPNKSPPDVSVSADLDPDILSSHDRDPDISYHGLDPDVISTLDQDVYPSSNLDADVSLSPNLDTAPDLDPDSADKSLQKNNDQKSKSENSNLQDNLDLEVTSCSCRDNAGVVFPEGFLSSVECVICLDDYHHGVSLCGLPCGHTFHEDCVVTWLKKSNHFCPVCRWPAYQSKLCQMHVHSE